MSSSSSSRPNGAKHSILDSLNSAQRRAVSSNASTVAILAGPGSGKTHTLTSRVVWLIDHVGFQPQDVVVATFTVKAAREMKERIGKALGNGRENKIVLGTFHSIARRYLAAYGRHIGLDQKFGIADDADSRSIIARICKRLQLAVDPPAARAWISKKKAKGTTETTSTHGNRQPPKSVGIQELETCFKEYQAHLDRSKLLDYDDLLVRCVELLRDFPSCVSNIQTVLIDEYQDTNGVQYELMKLLAQRHNRITVVGDPDQSIYGWRSADIRNLRRLLGDFPRTDEISLEENYRSSQSILDLSLLVIQQDANRYPKILKPVHNKGSRPVLRKLKGAAVEAEWIVAEIRRALLMSGGMLTHNDVAILLRSASLSRHVESALGKAGIAYKMVGGFKFYERTEIKVLLDYLRVIHQPENNDALARIMNVPKRGIGDTTIKSLVEEAERSSLSLWSLLNKHCRGDRTAKTRITKPTEQKLSGDLLRLLNRIRERVKTTLDSTPFGLVQVIEQLLKDLNFDKYLQATYPDDHETRWANIQEFINLAGDFVRDLNKEGNDDSLPEIDGVQQTKEDEVLPRFLANIALAADAQKTEDGQETKPLVTVSTIHAAKGLEWPIVFIPAVYSGSIPHMRAEDTDEERRLLYVAMTRAQSLLYLSYPVYSAMGNGERNELSPFVAPVAKYFADKGPCFDRPIVAQIAQVLQRKLPSNEAVYKDLPTSGFNPEDNLYPVDPDQVPREQDRSSVSYSEGSRPAERPRAKRPRLYGPAGITAALGENDGEGEDHQWCKPHATTMEQASNFTVSSLPGFVSVSAHQVALTAAAEANKRKYAEQTAAANKRPASSTRRPADQKSILGFVRSSSSLSSGKDSDVQVLPRTASAAGSRQPPPGARQQYQQHTANPTLPFLSTTTLATAAIEPELASHKLGASRSRMMTTATRPSTNTTTANTAANGPRKQYTCFSSSPTKPEPPSDIKVGTESKAEDVDDEPLPEPTRSAACLHATTCNVLPKGLYGRGVGPAGGGGGGIRRPVGLGKGEGIIAPMDRLRKPFKPLTINRSLK